MSMPEDTGTAEVNPVEAILEAAGAAFQEAIATGANAAAAFEAASNAAQETAIELGVDPEISEPVINSAGEAYQAALDRGASPQEAFDASGDAALEAVSDDDDLIVGGAGDNSISGGESDETVLGREGHEEALAAVFDVHRSSGNMEEEPRETTHDALGKIMDQDMYQGRPPADEERNDDRARAEATAAQAIEDEERDEDASDEANP